MKVVVVDQHGILSGDRGLWRELQHVDGLDVVLVAPERWREGGLDLHCEPESSGLKVLSAKAVFSGKSHRAFYPALAKILHQESPDLLYVNAEPESFLALQASMVRRKECRLAFMSWRNIDYAQGDFPYKLPQLNVYAERMVLNNADLCIAHNGTARDIFTQKGVQNIALIPAGVDTGIFSPPTRRPDRPVVFGFVGRVVREKGIDLLFHAVAGFSFDYRILVVGGGPAKEELVGLAQRLQIQNRVEWVDPVPHPQMPELLRRMDVLVLPSRTTRYWKEQFGRVLIEAMACGVVVVGSDSGEIPRVIEQAGLVFKEEDVAGLRQALQEMENSLKREEYARRGIERVRERFSIRVVARLYKQAFEGVHQAT